MTRFLKLSCFATLSLVGVSSAPGAVSLLNPSFEDRDASSSSTAEYWIPNNTGLVYRRNLGGAFLVHDGNFSLQLYVGGIASQYCAPVSPGEQIIFSAYYVSQSSQQLTGNDYGLLEMVFKDSEGKALGAGTFDSELLRPVDTDIWRQKSLTATAPAGTAGVDFVLKVVHVGGGPASSLIFDQLTAVTAVPEPVNTVLAILLGLIVIAGGCKNLFHRGRTNRAS